MRDNLTEEKKEYHRTRMALIRYNKAHPSVKRRTSDSEFFSKEDMKYISSWWLYGKFLKKSSQDLYFGCKISKIDMWE